MSSTNLFVYISTAGSLCVEGDQHAQGHTKSSRWGWLPGRPSSTIVNLGPQQQRFAFHADALPTQDIAANHPTHSRIEAYCGTFIKCREGVQENDFLTFPALRVGCLSSGPLSLGSGARVWPPSAQGATLNIPLVLFPDRECPAPIVVPPLYRPCSRGNSRLTQRAKREYGVGTVHRVFRSVGCCLKTCQVKRAVSRESLFPESCLVCSVSHLLMLHFGDQPATT